VPAGRGAHRGMRYSGKIILTDIDHVSSKNAECVFHFYFMNTEPTTCWYCKTEPATAETSYKVRLYRIGPSQQLQQQDVAITRCTMCRDRHSEHDSWTNGLCLSWSILSLMGIVWGLVYFDIKEKIGVNGIFMYSGLALGLILVGLWTIKDWTRKITLGSILPEKEWAGHSQVQKLKTQGWCNSENEARSSEKSTAISQPLPIQTPSLSPDPELTSSPPKQPTTPLSGSQDLIAELESLFDKTKAYWLKLDRPVQGEVMAILVMTAAFHFLRDEVGEPHNRILCSAQARWLDKPDIQTLQTLNLGPPEQFDVHDLPRVSEQFKTAITSILRLKLLLSGQ
jgi:hypothetical protein